jgi:hypothetical protein
LTGITHVLLIDESGNGRLLADGSPDPGIRSLWVTAGVLVEWPNRSTLESDVRAVLRSLFLSRCSELRAANIRRYLPPNHTVNDVAQLISSAVQRSQAHVWVAGSRAGDPMYSHPMGKHAEPKDIARQLLLETVCGYAVPKYFGPESWMMIWDVSDAGDLADFSRTVATFRNRISGYGAPPALIPRLLGGLSHEWGGIQVADLYANLALHKVGCDLGLVGAKRERADAFDRYLEPTLQRDTAGKSVGWKIWKS